MNGIEQPRGKSPFPIIVVILIGLFAVSIIPLVNVIGLQQPDGGIRRKAIEIVPILQVNNNEQEIVLSADEVTLYIPKDAIDLTGKFVILPRQADIFPSRVKLSGHGQL